ncbi:MAG: hypothetical protein DYG85_16780 [Chloroflexi bacterium CFX1]|nr:hypothetical protein [Chloroflexi bacterium CFX1]MCQ3954610.1 hypothetical protein [Chloroflexota bacterium]MDL1918691.1 hypothetical protein [Chloroflexi bacterium CFX5]
MIISKRRKTRRNRTKPGRGKRRDSGAGSNPKGETSQEKSMDQPQYLLLMAVIQEQDLDSATKAMQGIGASLTYLSSAGGFLGRRNATLLVGLPADKLQDSLSVLREACKQRVEYMTLPLEGSPMPMPAPVPVTVGGATVFALPVERFEQI